jgi:TRAP-type mannitol/chloroaromatic compound transport system permease large subunit
MSKVALPEMKKYRYSDSMATGSVAAGGIIGILIPPSVILVLYGLLTESSIGDLFIAGFLAWYLTIIVFMIVISIVTRLHPESGPGGKIHMETKAKRHPENMGDYGTFCDCDRRYLLWCFHPDRGRRCRGLWCLFIAFSQTPKPRDDERDFA